MILLGNFLIAVAQILNIIFNVLYWLILIRALISWVNPDPYNPIVQFLNRTTEPILTPIRRIMPRMAVDVSPIIAFLGIIFLQTLLVGSLTDVGKRMKYQNQRPVSYQIQRQERAVPQSETLSADQLIH